MSDLTQDEAIVEALATALGPISDVVVGREDVLEAASDALFALRAAGFDVYRPDPSSCILLEKVGGRWPTWAIDAVVLTHADMHQPDSSFKWEDFLDALTRGKE